MLITSLDLGDLAMNLQSRRLRAQQLRGAEATICGATSIEGAPVAPGNDRTLRELCNPVWRRPQLRAPLSDLLTVQPEAPFDLD